MGPKGEIGLSFDIGLRMPPKLESQGLEALATWGKSVGLRALDLPNPDPAAVEVLTRHGLSLGTVDAVGLGDLISQEAERRARGAAALRQRIDGVAAVGGKTIFACIVPGREISRRQGFEIWAEVFPPLVEYAESKGISFALEGWPGGAPWYQTIGYTPEVLRAMFAKVSSPSLGLCYDPSHLVRLGIDYIRFLDEFGNRVRHCHGKDTELLPEGRYLYGTMPPVLDEPVECSEGAWRYCVPGDGEVDWARVAARLQFHGYRGPISIELEDARYSGTLELEQAGVAKAANHLRTVS